ICQAVVHRQQQMGAKEAGENDEIRRRSNEGMSEAPNDKERVATSALFRVSLFGFNSAFDIRISLFESEWSFEGLNRNLFDADFPALSAERADSYSVCQLTSILVS